jgi:hypothetical protein
MILCFLSLYELKHCDRNKMLRSIEKHDIIINHRVSHIQCVRINNIKSGYKMLEHITWLLNFRTTNNSVIDPKLRCKTFLLVHRQMAIFVSSRSSLPCVYLSVVLIPRPALCLTWLWWPRLASVSKQTKQVSNRNFMHITHGWNIRI